METVTPTGSCIEQGVSIAALARLREALRRFAESRAHYRVLRRAYRQRACEHLDRHGDPALLNSWLADEAARFEQDVAQGEYHLRD